MTDLDLAKLFSEMADDIEHGIFHHEIRAKLCLMVVEDDFKHHGYDFVKVVLSQRNINPEHYQAVKERVEAAK